MTDLVNKMVDKSQLLIAMDNIVTMQQTFADTESAFPPKYGTHMFEYITSRIQDYWKSARYVANEPEAEVDVSINDYSLRLIPKNEAAERVLTLYEKCCVERSLLSS